MDHYHDTCHKELVKLASSYNLPDYAKEAELDSSSLRKLSSYEFAFPEARYFPIHTKEDTLLSSAFFLSKKAEFGKYQNSIYDRLKAACNAYNILDDFSNLESFEKQASTKEYLLPELKKFPINSEAELEKAAEWLDKQRDIFPPEILQRMRSDLEKKADDLGCTDAVVPTEVLNLNKAAELLTARAKKVENPLLKEAMAKFTKALVVTQTDGDSSNPDMIEKLAEFVDRFDKITGVNPRGVYGRGKDVFVGGNEEALLAMEKTAAARLTIDGKTYHEEDLEKVSMDKLKDGLGESFVGAVTDSKGNLDLEKFAEISETLPLPDKRILAMYLG